MIMLNELIPIINEDAQLSDAIKLISSKSYKIYDLCLITNESSKLKGVLNSNDILQLLSKGISGSTSLKDVMIEDPVYAFADDSYQTILDKVTEQVSARTNGRKKYTRYIPILNPDLSIVDVIDFYELISKLPSKGANVAVYGLGFVGLTLAVTLANRGHFVKGIDNNNNLINQLSKGIPHVHEPRMQEMLQKAITESTISFANEITDKHCDVSVISVGTPIDLNSCVSLDALESVTKNIGRGLRRGDLVMLRSTVPVGTSRALVIPLLEKESGLTCGKDFSLAFTPERTVEGNAMKEITSLPQILGGFSPSCLNKASSFWQTITDNVVSLESLEASELVKLLNNSFRDLSFSFANAFSLLADKYNIDSSKVIQAANEGYPRDKIPRPSPGVGGYCLTKDPLLYGSVFPSLPHNKLARMGREANEEASNYPMDVILRYIQREKLSLNDLTIVVAGIAFKGLPETNDMRGSIGLQLTKNLKKKGSNIYAFDAVVSNQEIEKFKLKSVNNYSDLERIDALIIMNNHPLNIQDGFLSSINRKLLIFDGWSLYDRKVVESYKNVTYSNMGYMTLR